MYLATAYPNSAISAWAMTVIALVMVASLAAWLILVFLADSRGSARKTRQAGNRTPVPTALAQAAEDEHGEAGRLPDHGRHQAAA